MSINGYLMAGRINFIAAIFGVILTGILYWKLDIRKACSMLYDLPIKPKPAKPQKQPLQKSIITDTEAVHFVPFSNSLFV